MKIRERLVVDTNALVSHLLLPESVPGLAVRRAIAEGQLLVSEATLLELADVLARQKFDRYVSLPDRQEFIRRLGGIAELVPCLTTVRACRDPRNDKFVEVAVNGNARLLITGDTDLLALDPFHDVRILSPADWLPAASPGPKS